jgi:hypothetical protein
MRPSRSTYGSPIGRWAPLAANVWVKTRQTDGGARRYRVEFRVGGRDLGVQYGGRFKRAGCS